MPGPTALVGGPRRSAKRPTPTASMPATVPLKRTLIVSFGLLVGGGVLVAGVVLGLTLPTLTAPQHVFGLLSAVLGITLTVVVVVGSWLLDQRLVEPLNRMV